MSYLVIGIAGVLAGFRALGLRRKVTAGDSRSSSPLLRPAFLASMAGIAFAGGAFLLLTGTAVLMAG
ncbi:hypothetical protein [Streptomyces mangrovisoli]|uniref:Uncharacterized protein n=1 Tax=Streptomyces mangrovisoli TaxID=1428628 RepID=A0A1J4P1L8_9ACTN|nr:hypothetical protein [Streptomyces mangrovisoli]OIJ68464.1 hypothetical protein WN71_008605 [Streptomyces mangrovisoli]